MKNLLQNKTRRKYNVDESYFQLINTPEKAYWLGFIYADGHNSKRGDALVIGLKASDIKHLEKFKKSILSDHKILIKTNNSGYAKNSKLAILEIYSKKISASLSKIGCVHNKTKSMELPKIPEEFYSHFVRGFFDGDGCITYLFDKKGLLRLRFYFAVNNTFCEQLKELIETTLDIRTKVYDQINIKRLYIFRQNDILKLLKWMYQESSVDLDRKKCQSNMLVNLYNLAYKRI